MEITEALEIAKDFENKVLPEDRGQIEWALTTIYAEYLKQDNHLALIKLTHPHLG